MGDSILTTMRKLSPSQVAPPIADKVIVGLGMLQGNTSIVSILDTTRGFLKSET